MQINNPVQTNVSLVGNSNIYSSSFPDNKGNDFLLSKSLPLSFLLDKPNPSSSNSTLNSNPLGIKEKLSSNNNSLVNNNMNDGFNFSSIKGNQSQSGLGNSNNSLRDDKFNMNYSSFANNKMTMNNNFNTTYSRNPINNSVNHNSSSLNPFSTSLPSTNASFMNAKGSIIGQADWTAGNSSLNFDSFLMKNDGLKSNESSVSGESFNNDDNTDQNDNIDEFDLMLDAQLGDMMNNMDLEMENQLNNYNNNNYNNSQLSASLANTDFSTFNNFSLLSLMMNNNLQLQTPPNTPPVILQQQQNQNLGFSNQFNKSMNYSLFNSTQSQTQFQAAQSSLNNFNLSKMKYNGQNYQRNNNVLYE
jgi:hypothetical protein